MKLAYYVLKHQEARARAANDCLHMPEGTCVTFAEKGRSLDQNDKIHPMVRDIANHVKWQRGGQLLPMSEPQWRHFFAAHIRKNAELVPNIDGDGFIALGVGTSELSARECSDLIELMYAFGSERGVVWSEKSKEHYQRFGNKWVLA